MLARSLLFLIPMLCLAAEPTLHRLNRTEYDYSVQDLLGVDLRPAADFPQDDSGHGFDNNRDALSTAPLLIDRYMAAAEKLARFVVFGAPPVRPTVVTYRNTLRGSPQLAAGAAYDNTSLSVPSAQHVRHNFPADGEYRFVVILDGTQPAGSEPLRAAIWIDGARVSTAETAAGIQNGKVLELPARVAEGEHTVSACFINVLAGLAPPAVTTVRIASLEIRGPFGADGGPARPIDLAALASRAFRHPVTAPEMDRLNAISAAVRRQGGPEQEAQAAALQAILVSPQFLFRAGDEPASRLSYFIWSSLPDPELLHSDLRRPAVLEAQVRRMLRDPKSARLAENFGGQWLETRRLESLQPDVHNFPHFDEYLRFSMRRETELFFENIIREDRSILDFLDAKYSFLNQRLADLYGIRGVEGTEFRKADLTGSPRAGVLTQASVLTVSSLATRTSPVLRGKWILQNLLNAAPPSPPAGVPTLDEASAVGLPLRQQMEVHRRNPACAGCHAGMDPLGFGLENFDGIGQWREADATGTLPDGRAFHGPAELEAILRSQSDAFAKCFIEKLMTYALGRGLQTSDAPLVKDILKRTAARRYRFSDIVVEIAKVLS